MSGGAAPSEPGCALEVKGRMATLTVLRLLSTDLPRIEDDLAGLLSRARGLFRQSPVVLDAAALEAGDGAAVLGSVADLLRRRGMVPVGAVGIDEDRAAEAGLAVLRGLEQGGSARRRAAAAEPVPAPAGSRVVDTPVRSGQQIYARGGDLVVLAPVSAGAEVLADGHVHVYGALRGRALAGVQGDTGARIFCQQLHAELISIAGSYLVSERLPEPVLGRAVQVRLEGDSLRVEPLAGQG